MKKTVLFFAVLAIFATAHGQQTTFGIKAGVSDDRFALTEEASGSSAKIPFQKVGFHAGVIADLAFTSHFSVQPQLLYAMKGGAFGIGSGEALHFDFNTVDLPINLLYHENGFFIGGGPNLSYAFTGKVKSNGTSYDIFDKNNGLFGAGDVYAKRFQFGINGTMGYQLACGLVLSTNYSTDLSDMLNEDAAAGGDYKGKNAFWGFSIGYMFSKTHVAKKK